jgi:hypothetical protein
MKFVFNTEEEKNGFSTFMMGPSTSKDYENHVVFQKLRYNIPKIFETMLEMHQDKEKWDKTRERSCILHLGFSGSTNQQSEIFLTKAIDARTAITAKPEMNGKQDGSLGEFYRMIGVLSFP